MKIYKKHRHGGMLFSIALVAATAVFVAVTVDNPVGGGILFIVSGIAVVVTLVAALRRVALLAADCGALMACAASLSVALSMVSGGVTIAIGVAIGVLLIAATVLLFLSAEAAAQETHSRLRK